MAQAHKRKYYMKTIKKAADSATDLGVELLVIDDGWFGKRNNDHTSLGDWNVN